MPLMAVAEDLTTSSGEELVVSAAKVKAQGGLSYADAFAVATAQRLLAPLWTGDPEIIDRAAKLSCNVRDLRI